MAGMWASPENIPASHGTTSAQRSFSAHSELGFGRNFTGSSNSRDVEHQAVLDNRKRPANRADLAVRARRSLVVGDEFAAIDDPAQVLTTFRAVTGYVHRCDAGRKQF